MSAHVGDETLAAGGVRVAWTGPEGEPVVTVTMDRPERRNAQTPATWRAFRAIGGALPTGTRVVVLRGEGPVFSAGIDLRTFTPEGVDGEQVLTAISSLDDTAAADLVAEFQAGFTWWHDLDDVITVAVVQGAAVGAAFQLALACDLRVCSTDARFAMRETSLGLVPDLTGTHALVELVGYHRALDICATGRWVGAEEAAALGIATTVVAPEALDTAARDVVASLLSAPESAVRATKSVLRHAVGATAEEQRRFERETQIGLIRAVVSGA